MKIDILKVIDEVDRCLFKRMDLTEKELKTLSSLVGIMSAVSTAYILLAIRQMKKQSKKLETLKLEIEELKNAKGE